MGMSGGRMLGREFVVVVRFQEKWMERDQLTIAVGARIAMVVLLLLGLLVLLLSLVLQLMQQLLTRWCRDGV